MTDLQNVGIDDLCLQRQLLGLPLLRRKRTNQMGGDAVGDELKVVLFLEQEKKHNKPTRTATTAVVIMSICSLAFREFRSPES